MPVAAHEWHGLDDFSGGPEVLINFFSLSISSGFALSCRNLQLSPRLHLPIWNIAQGSPAKGLPEAVLLREPPDLPDDFEERDPLEDREELEDLDDREELEPFDALDPPPPRPPPPRPPPLLPPPPPPRATLGAAGVSPPV